MNPLLDLLGPIDIYLVDQVLRDRIAPGMRILDAGSGGGRNLLYFLRSGYDVCAVDADPHAIDQVRRYAAVHAPHLAESNFRVEAIQDLSFPRGSFDVVISSAVLHFARDPDEFRAILEASWGALRVGGLFFCRLASTIGMADRCRPIGHGRFVLPDGSTRFLVDEQKLLALTSQLGGELLDPLKTTVVQDQRCMTTWVLRRC